MIAALAIVGGYASLVWAFGWPGLLVGAAHVLLLVLCAAMAPRSCNRGDRVCNEANSSTAHATPCPNPPPPAPPQA